MKRRLAILVAVFVTGCAAEPGGGGGGGGAEGGGPQEVAPLLDETGEFELTPGLPVRNASNIESRELAAAAADSSRVRIELGSGDLELSGFAEGQDCTATVDVYIDAWGVDSPCDTGRFLGTLEIRIASNSAEDISEPLDLEGEALANVTSGAFSLCMEAEADCSGTLRIVRLTYSFDDGAADGGGGGDSGGGGSGGGSDNWTTADLAGTWEGVGHERDLVIGADGTVLTETVQGCGDIPCDGEPYTCDTGLTAGLIEYAIDPYKMTIDPRGRITIEEHEIRSYSVDDPDPSGSFLVSGEGQLESADSMYLETFTPRMGITQEWSYTKVAN